MKYRNDPKFSDRQVWANSVDPDQTAPRGAVWSGSTLFAALSNIFWMHHSTVKAHFSISNFSIITAIFSGVQIYRIFMVLHMEITVKLLKIRTPPKIAVIILKFEQWAFTIESSVQMILDRSANSVDPDQSAPLGHYLPRSACPKI